MMCLGSGPHLRIAVVAASWRCDRRGRLVPVSFADGDAYLIGLKEDGVGEYLTTYGRARAGVIRALCKFLADDPVLCDRLASKEIDAYDFAEICRLYSPQGHDDGDGMNVRMAWNTNAAPCAEKGGGV